MLRNPSLINFLDGCALSLPIQPAGEAPVGLMVVGFSGEDERVLSAGLAIEAGLVYQGPVLVG
jgi:aspartyl-tRNA(Asn)/glutamyl-tRNA(Gln) amidotransferase subunit A